MTRAKRSECTDSAPAPQPKAAQAAQLSELSRLFDLHADFVYRVLLRLGVPRGDAEDCVQDVFMVVAHRLSDYEERGAMRAWLYVIARQVALHALRSNRRRARSQLEVVPSAPADDPHRQLVQKQAVALVHEFLAELDEPQAQAFYLAEIEQLSMPEIAAALDIKLNTAYSRLRLARQRLSQWIAARLKDAP